METIDRFTKPYLSIVVTSRNDDRGGGMLDRMQVFIKVLMYFSRRYRLDLELIIVEWNPPSGSAPLKKVLNWEGRGSGQSVRIIPVPPYIHNQFPQADKIPLFQFIAKNVGIRRANGEFILCTNLDIVFSEGIIEFLSSKKLSRECLYRVDRHDIAPAVPKGLSPQEVLGFCLNHIVRVHTSDGTFPRVKKESAYEHLENLFYKIRNKFRSVGKNSLIPLHTVACGDFTLMAKDHWNALRGYPEMPSHAYVDGLICYMGVTHGLREVVLGNSLKIYHQEHGDMFLDEGSSRPVMEYDKYLKYCSDMVRKGEPIIFNDKNWGLGNTPLNEEIVCFMEMVKQ